MTSSPRSGGPPASPSPGRAELTARYTFPIDRFQADAFDSLDRGDHVVVAAPTGSGKTVVAEYGIAMARAAGHRAFYTAPIKALSNQKYRDLASIHGEDAVGLLTGDNAINGDAPIVVMTTEVLRNMIYGRSRALPDHGQVVLDKVTILQDPYRGPVWEEVIIHLPQSVRLVCLSATVSNVAELAEWITTVRGSTTAIVERQRPVELKNEYLVADQERDRLQLLPVFVDGRANRDALQLDDAARPGLRRHGGDGRSGRGRRVGPPGRVETIELLDQRRMLPAIFFIFSRAQCDAAAKACLDAGLQLTSADERRVIRRIIANRLGNLETADLDVLGYAQFVAQLDIGVAAHHAGMVPPMKEVVEECFLEGLVKVVFATETLAVGINMPARSVVIEKLTKFTGEHHQQLTPGEYTQLTGRAGRRGIDNLGHAVVLWSPWVRFDEVAELAGSTAFHLRSAFRPTYNMAANLIRTYTSEEAHHLLNLSFAQYQADRDIVRLEARLDRLRLKVAELRREAASDFGDIEDYRRRRAEAADRRSADRARRAGDLDELIGSLRPGAIIDIAAQKHRGPVVLVATAHRKGGVRLTVVNRGGHDLSIAVDELEQVPAVVGSIQLPGGFAPQRRDWRNEVAKRLRQAKVRRPAAGGTDRRTFDQPPGRTDMHPVEHDPDLRAKLRAASDADRVAREIADTERRVAGKSRTLGQDFDRVLDVLRTYGYVDVDAWELTEGGEMLARTFHECDLLVTEIVRAGLLDGLGSADLAALVSVVVYEHRSPEPAGAPWFSSPDVRDRWRRIAAISEELQAQERAVGLAEHRAPDATFAGVAHAWVAGEGFAEVVGDEELTGGDFVRTVKQLIDLLRQLSLIAPSPDTRRAAGAAAEAAFRGVVADSSAPTEVGVT
ncbi:MAG: DEAD/DEAH box helicase [Ilumatobacteraceae bacterium]